MKLNKIILFISFIYLTILGTAQAKKSSEFLKELLKNYSYQYSPADKFEGQYIVKSFSQKDDQKFEGELEYNGSLDFFLQDTNPVIKNLKIAVKLDNNNEITLKIQPKGQPFFELPQEEPFPHEKNTASESSTPVYKVVYPEVGEPFNISITFNGVVVFDTNNQYFVFTKQYVAFGTSVFGEKIWGWGQQRGVWQYETGSYTIWNLDNPGQMTTGTPGQETYGTHPVILQASNQNSQGQDVDTQYFMQYLRTSYGLQLDYTQNQNSLFQMFSGPIELKFFMYSNPRKNIEAYSKYVNGWALPPFWSLGFHLCRWGWKTVADWAKAWEDADNYNISFDTLWSDIDYMQDYEDFTISTDYNVEQMKVVTDLQTQQGVHWVPIIDAGVAYKGDSGLKGLNEGLYIVSKQTGESLIGCVWPGPAYFVDWNKPGTTEFWVQGLKNITEVYNGPQPSGIWLDMNDPSSFTDQQGQVYDADQCNGQMEFPTWGYPWSPLGEWTPMSYKTIATDSTHYNEEDANYVYIEDFDITEFEFHDLYAFLEGIATRKYLEQTGHDLPFIISRSSFAGQGKYTQLWTGDNDSTWEQLKTSLGDIFNFQLFQIPMAGPDTCGFSQETTAELCARWFQLGAFYPFFRSHNAIDVKDQYPWSFPEDPYVLESSRNSINLRYSLLKWYYTIFVREQPHGTLFNPLFFDYPNDEMAQNEGHQALIGNEIMISPVLDPAEEGQEVTNIKVYFPGDTSTKWYQYQDPTQIITGGEVGEFTVSFYDTCPFFLKTGSIIVQQPQYIDIDYSNRSRLLGNEFTLVIAFDEAEEASGNFLGVEDFGEKSIKQNCLGDNNNCMLQIKAKKVNATRVQVTIEPINNNTNYPGEINVTGLNILSSNINKEVSAIFDENNTRFLFDL